MSLATPALLAIISPLLLLPGRAPAGEAPPERALYNGIELPEPWPPRLKDFPDDPQRPPYLVAPPNPIVIDVGRQLFVDDFLIEQTTLKRTFHQPQFHPATPVLKPDQPWELAGRGAFAAPFSDGVWFDPQDRIFKMWYYAGHSVGATCYATSKDGIHWEKPKLDVEPGTNIVFKASRDSGTVWLDPSPRDPSERFKMALWQGSFRLYRSPDGIHWSKAGDGAKTGDRSTFFHNPFRQRWVFSIRSSSRLGRSRLYWETSDFFSFSSAVAAKGELVPWVAADSADAARDDLQVKPQLYNLDCAAYESVLVGLFSVWRGDYNKATTAKGKELFAAGRPKQNSICVGFSRDGFHWDRPDRRPFIPVSEKAGDWNWGNVQSTAPCCLVVGEQLWLYVSGRAGKSFPGCQNGDAGASTGLATLRRDGFASLDAGAEGGTLTTRPVRFRGKHLFVNLDAPQAETGMAHGET
ncbi:MAG: glycosyl hydrolase family 32, partial [Planctomycetota bacterium]|nr:glycosyl hydrolase family 32 [Planctomycetota bacterium]